MSEDSEQPQEEVASYRPGTRLLQDAARQSCTVGDVIRLFEEKQFRCSPCILGSQLGLTTSDLDNLNKGRYLDMVEEVLDTCSQRLRGLLNWSNISYVLDRPALRWYGSEVVLKIVTEYCRRGSCSSAQSDPLSPVSITSDYPFQKSLSLDTAEDKGKIYFP